MELLWRDVRLAMRRLLAAPGITLFAVVTLALGIGVTTGTFSVVYSGLWRPLGLADESRLVTISRSNMLRPGPSPISWAEFQFLAGEQGCFSGLAAWTGFASALAGQGTAELVDAELVNGDYFKTLGVEALKGRTLLPGDDRIEAPPVTVLSEAAWRSQFGGDPAIVGKRVKIAGRPFEVVGVAPRGFRGVNPDWFVTKSAWVPLAFAPVVSPEYRQVFEPGSGSHWLTVAGRIKADVTPVEAAAEVTRVGRRLDTVLPLPPVHLDGPGAPPRVIERYWTTGWLFDAERLNSSSEVGRLIVALPVLVLLIACTNLANLVLSRGVSRRQDYAVRRALGASRWRLIREQLIEQGMIAVCGGMAGLCVAYSLVNHAAGLARETLAPFIKGARIDWNLDAGVIRASVLSALLALIVAGLVPALHLTRDSLRGVLDQGGTASTPRWRGRGNLIALQVGVSVGLFLIAVVFIRILLTELPRPNSVDTPGLDRIAVATLPFGQQQRDEERTRETVGRLLADAELRTGTEAIAVMSNLPFGSTPALVRVTRPDQPFAPTQNPGSSASLIVASPNVFRALNTPLKFGREFNDRDTRDSVPVAIVNVGLALDLFGSADATGRAMLMRLSERPGSEDPRVVRLTIVGVVPGAGLLGSTGRHNDVVYAPLSQLFQPNLVVVARSTPGAAGSVDTLRLAIKRADPELAIGFIARGDVVAAGPMAFAPYVAVLLTSLALLALVLAMAGLYGVLSHVVARRTREMGIRMALGAAPGRIAWLVLKDGFRPIVEGLAIGLATAAIVRTSMKYNLFLVKIAPIDPQAFSLAIALLVAAGAAACYLPSRRASRIDPSVALRDW